MTNEKEASATPDQSALQSQSDPQTEILAPAATDHRLYLVSPEDCEVVAKRTWEKEYCYSKAEGEDHFHLLQQGELYLRCNNEKLCLNCALKRELLTTNRQHWQRR